VPSFGAHEEHLNATRKYLNEKGITFSEERLFVTSTDSFGKEVKRYASTRLTILSEE
jgi:hypothetical protein